MTAFNHTSVKNIHCIGIGGIGVSGLAELLQRQGFQVSGSDINETAVTARLKSLGLRVDRGHCAENLAAADLVVYSSAVMADNPEVEAARKLGIPLMLRGELLAELMRSYFAIAVSGTNGKTTTTGVIASIFETAEYDPTYVIGGQLRGRETTVRCGHSAYFIAEADESDASFLFMRPKIAVITNIQEDHLEHYHGDFNRLQHSFLEFVERLPTDGLAVVGIDCPILRSLLPAIRKRASRLLTFGFSEDADYRALNSKTQGLQSSFLVQSPAGSLSSLEMILNIPGRYNILNALAGITVAHEVGISNTALVAALENFPGMGRRFHPRGSIPVSGGTALLFEDYGHHPTAIAATLDMVRQVWPTRRIVMIFQPHRYSRTRDHREDFARVLSRTDKLVLLDVYAASEVPLEGGSAANLCDALKQRGRPPIFVPKLEEVPGCLQTVLQADDIVILQGAGNVGRLVTQLCK